MRETKYRNVATLTSDLLLSRSPFYFLLLVCETNNILLFHIRMSVYLIPKTSHSVKIMNNVLVIFVTVMLVLLVVVMIITGHCLGFNKKNASAVYHSFWFMPFIILRY